MTLIQTEFTLSNPHFIIPGKPEQPVANAMPVSELSVMVMKANVAKTSILHAITTL